MKKRLLCLMASLLLCGAAIAQEPAYVREHDNNMPVVAQVVLDEVPVTTSEWTLKAYIGDDQRGEAVIQTSLNNTYWIQVYYSTDTEDDTPVTFKIANANNQEYTSTTTLNTLAVGYGTLLQPQEIEFAATQTQSTTLAEGWSWWSTPIELSNINGLTMLEESLGHNGIIIKSQNYGVQNYYQNYGTDYWYGPLTNYGINNEQGYLIQTTTSCNITMRGAIADPANHPIALNQGWTWIGYPVNSQQTIATALAGFTPSANDVIKSQSGGATYYAGYGWYPNTFLLTPGQSYQYQSNTSGNTLTYSISRSSDVIAEDTPLHWSNDIHSFPNNILVMATVFIDGVEQRRGDIELGAFVGGECRGSAKLNYFEPTGHWYAMLIVTGEEGDAVEFGIYDGSCDETNMSCVNYITYADNAVVGNLDTPFEVHFGTKEELHVYPNPIDRNQPFTIDIPLGETVKEMLIINAMGEVIRYETGALDMLMKSGMQTTGVYTIRVICKSGNVYHIRLIVK